MKADGELVDYLFCDLAFIFCVRGHVYEVSFPDLGGQNKLPIQLRMQGISVENYNMYMLAQQQQQPLPRKQTNSQYELNFQKIDELCDFFSRRVVSEPYDAFKIASFVTLLLMPI